MTFVQDGLQRLPRQTRAVVLTVIYGLSAGLSAVGFEVGISLFYNATYLHLAQASPSWFLGGTFLVITSTSLAAGFLLSRYCPEAAGSGIPQLKLAFWKDFGYVPFRVVWVKFIAGLITVGGGASLGREGPTVQLAGGATSNLAGVFGIAKTGRRQAAAAGAAAGLAAAFNAPLAAITFVLEEIIEDLNNRMLGSVILAAVLGAFVVQGLVSNHPAFDLPEINTPSWRGYALTPLAATLSALVGVVFQAGCLGLREAFRRRSLRVVPPMLRPLLGGWVTWAIGGAIFLRGGHHLGIFSLGYRDLTLCLQGQLAWTLAALLLFGKLVATICSYGTGGCGGIFAPNLFFGGMCGAALAGLCRSAGIALTQSDQILLTVVGMSACLGAVVRAPLTSILIVFEMTHEFSLVPALLAGGLISQAVCRVFLQHGFYEQVLVDDGHFLKTVMPPRDLRGWRQYPVSAIANFNPVVLSDLSPANVRDVLERRPFNHFPVITDGASPAVIVRHEALAALAEGHAPPVHPVPTCLREQTIGEAQVQLIGAEHGMILLLDKPGGIVVGLLTLHDLLRAQDAIAQQGDG